MTDKNKITKRYALESASNLFLADSWSTDLYDNFLFLSFKEPNDKKKCIEYDVQLVNCGNKKGFCNIEVHQRSYYMSGTDYVPETTKISEKTVSLTDDLGTRIHKMIVSMNQIHIDYLTQIYNCFERMKT